MSEQRFGVLAYRGTRNLGDAIQTVAVSRLLPGRLIGVFRDRPSLPPGEAGVPLVVNGWLGDRPGPGGRNNVFAGVFVGRNHEENYAWVRESARPAGARDPWTWVEFARREIPGEFVGCATLTLPRYNGPRRGELGVDWGEGAETNTIAGAMSWPAQWGLAARRLEQLRRAAVVRTCRLHAALPCVALGTPVYLDPPRGYDPERFSIWAALGLPFREVVLLDASACADQYRAFLARELNVCLADGPPQMPEMGEPV